MTTSFGAPVAAIWTPKRIYLAAQKIHAVKDVHFAASGLTGMAEGIAAALGGSGSFTARVGALAENLNDPLTRAVEEIQASQPEEFKKLAGKDVLDILIIARNHGETALARATFKAKRRGKGVVLESRQAHYPNAGTSLSSLEVLAAGVDEAGFKSATPSQEALVYPEKTLARFRSLAGIALDVVKLSDSGAEHSTLS